jgi:hypothetical protein
MGAGKKREAEASGRRRRVRAAHVEYQSRQRGAERYKLVPATPKHKKKAAVHNTGSRKRSRAAVFSQEKTNKANNQQSEWEDIGTCIPYHAEMIAPQNNVRMEFLRG